MKDSFWCCAARTEKSSNTDNKAASRAGSKNQDFSNNLKADNEKGARDDKLSKSAQEIGVKLGDRTPSKKMISLGAYAKLEVQVDSAEGLMPMDISFNASKLEVEQTLDAFVRLSINDDEPFGITSTQWKSTGFAKWEQYFSVELCHPQSFLCLKVCDDDPLFAHDGPLALSRTCGWIEIPLSSLPRNSQVSGWFSMHHAELADDHMNLADREHKLQEENAKKAKRKSQSGDSCNREDEENLEEEDAENKSAGRIKLHMFLHTSATKEFLASMQPAPVFDESIPPLDVPQFLEDVLEIKRLIIQRLILAPIRAFFYSLSWEKPWLSASMLCWHIFVCYNKEYISASLWIVVLLLFWHEIPPQDDGPRHVNSDPRHLGEGLLKGGTVFAKEAAAGVNAAFWKPIQGAQKGFKGGIKQGIVGWARGVKEGFDDNIQHTVSAVKGMTANVGKGFGSTLDQLGIHGIGLQEFQHLLTVKPGLANMVRGFQPTAHSTRARLQLVDDYFYWANVRTTKPIVIIVIVCLLTSVIFRARMGVVSGYGYLIGGSLFILSKARFFNVFVSAIKSLVFVCRSSKNPYSTFPGFQGC